MIQNRFMAVFHSAADLLILDRRRWLESAKSEVWLMLLGTELNVALATG